MERPTLRQLEIFSEIARIGTFRGAARALGLSQVAVSDHVRQLESRLGCELFVRVVGGKPSLSAAGKRVLEHGRNVLFACDSLIAVARSAVEGPAEGVEEVQQSSEQRDDALIPKSEPEAQAAEPVTAPEPVIERVDISVKPADKKGAELVSGESEKPIAIAAHPSMLSRFQEQLAAAQEAFPDRPISLDFGCYTVEAAYRALMRGTADIALFYTVDGDPLPLESHYLWSETWSLFTLADHPLAAKALVEHADCVDLPVIMPDANGPLRPLYEEALGKVGLWPAPTVLETDDYASVLTELGYGEAAFAAFGAMAAQFAARPSLRRLSLAQPIPAVEVRRAIATGAQDDPTIAALAGLLN